MAIYALILVKTMLNGPHKLCASVPGFISNHLAMKALIPLKKIIRIFSPFRGGLKNKKNQKSLNILDVFSTNSDLSQILRQCLLCYHEPARQFLITLDELFGNYSDSKIHLLSEFGLFLLVKCAHGFHSFVNFQGMICYPLRVFMPKMEDLE